MICPCGNAVVADTEDWETPLCYECWLDTPEGAAENYANQFAKWPSKRWKELKAEFLKRLESVEKDIDTEEID